MTKIPKDAPNPLSAQVEPVEGVAHPAFGRVERWIDKALGSEPSAGVLGRSELLRIWEQLPAEARKNLVRAGRVLLERERADPT